MWTIVIVFGILWGCLCAGIGSSKHRDGFGWFALGLFFGVFALIAVCAVPSLDKK